MTWQTSVWAGGTELSLESLVQCHDAMELAVESAMPCYRKVMREEPTGAWAVKAREDELEDVYAASRIVRLPGARPEDESVVTAASATVLADVRRTRATGDYWIEPSSAGALTCEFIPVPSGEIRAPRSCVLALMDRIGVDSAARVCLAARSGSPERRALGTKDRECTRTFAERVSYEARFLSDLASRLQEGGAARACAEDMVPLRERFSKLMAACAPGGVPEGQSAGQQLARAYGWEPAGGGSPQRAPASASAPQ